MANSRQDFGMMYRLSVIITHTSAEALLKTALLQRKPFEELGFVTYSNRNFFTL